MHELKIFEENQKQKQEAIMMDQENVFGNK